MEKRLAILVAMFIATVLNSGCGPMSQQRSAFCFPESEGWQKDGFVVNIYDGEVEWTSADLDSGRSLNVNGGGVGGY